MNANHPLEFFTERDMVMIQRFAETPMDSKNEEHVKTYEYLSGVFNKIAYWAQQVQLTAFPEGYSQQRRRPTNRAGHFTPYLWARIYPRKNSPRELVFSLEMNAEDTFIIKIDTYSLSDTVVREKYETYRGDWYRSEIVEHIPYTQMLSGGWDELIKRTANYFKERIEKYDELVTILGLDKQSKEHTESRVKSDEPVKEKSSPPNNNNSESIKPPESFVIKEITDGVIGVKKLAMIMADLLRNLDKSEGKGKMVGIFGNWGRGKTFLFNKIWDELEKKETPKNPFILVKFHAWKYQDTPASWAYLYEAFAKEYYSTDKQTNWIKGEWLKFRKTVRLNDKRTSRMEIITTTILFTVATGGLVLSLFMEWFKQSNWYLGTLLSAPLAYAIWSGISRISKNWLMKDARAVFRKYYTRVSFNGLLGVQAEIQKELRALLNAWLKGNLANKKVLLFVDDIDRCGEENIVKIIDALRVMLDEDEIAEKVVVVAAVDERVLKRAIKWKYHDLITKDLSVENRDRSELTLTLANEYMDKLFLAGIHLGTLTESEREKILVKTMDGKVLSDQKTISGASSTKIYEEEDEEESLAPYPNQKTKTTDLSLGLHHITDAEEELLRGLMKHNTDLTPRQIRIFYYRYLLARNVLISRKGKATTITGEEQKNLASLLMKYTLEKDKQEIAREKIRITNESDINVNVLGRAVKLQGKEYMLYLEALETVIAY